MVRLPRTIRLAVSGKDPEDLTESGRTAYPTHAPENIAAGFAAYGLEVRPSPPVAAAGIPADPEQVRGELVTMFAAEEVLVQRQLGRDAARRLALRQGLRSLVGHGMRAASAVHRGAVSGTRRPGEGAVAARAAARERFFSRADAGTRRGGSTPDTSPSSPRRVRQRVAAAASAGRRAEEGGLWRLFRPRQREAIRLAGTGLALGGLVAFAASVGHLPIVAQETASLARRATTTFRQGVGALLAADTTASAAAFATSVEQYQGALRSLHASTTTVQRLAARLDPARRLRSAEALLRAGASLSIAGQRASRLLQRFTEPGGRSLTETLSAALPELEALVDDLRTADQLLADVDLADVPEAERETVRVVRESVRALRGRLAFLLASRHVVLELLGASRDRQYLVLFQNNRELRPTGGFLGSFALVDVSRGAVTKIQADTMYNPDGQLKEFLVPPAPLQKISDRWYARDANWFADFRVSAAKVASLFEQSGGPSVNGVIALTPTVLIDLLRVTGPIPMPAYDVTVTADTAVDEIQRQVTYAYDRERNEPKAFLADLLPEVFARVASLPQERWGSLLEALAGAVRRKHLLVYFADAEAEEAALTLGWAGAVQPPVAEAGVLGDALGRVEANVGGHKTDDLIEQAVEYDVSADGADGALTATLVVTRHHRGSPDGTPGLPPEEDPQRKPNVVYERTFVPRGSTLLEARGFVPEADVPAPIGEATARTDLDLDPDLQAVTAHDLLHASGMTVGEESGFTTFGGWVITRPGETSVTVLAYRLPFRIPRPSVLAAILRYELHLIHQPGHQPVYTRATLRLPDAFRVAWSGPDGVVREASEHKAVMAAHVDQDLTWGAVIEEK